MDGHLHMLTEAARPSTLLRQFLYAALRTSRASGWVRSLAGLPDNEFGESKCAPLSTPTPSRSTSSPPSQPPTKARGTAMNDRASAVELGFCGAEFRSSQLPMNRSTTTTFTPPCMSPIVFARVPEGMAHQSMTPNTAASKPPMIPAAIIQKEIPNQETSLFAREIMSKES